MEIQPDGTILIRAALDGGFYRVDLVESSYPLYLNRDAGTGLGGGPILAGLSMYGNAAGVSLDQPPGGVSSTVAQKQKAIHASIAQLRQGRPMTFQAAWQQLQSTRPELFQGMEPTVIHPD